MMIPEHQPKKDGKNKAFAPYNFIPLVEKIVPGEELPDQNSYGDGTSRLDGSIVCKITTITPTYTRTLVDPPFFKRWNKKIPELMRDEAARKEYARFFHYNSAGDPEIPGSSLRGMTRALVEIIGYGKMQPVTQKPLVYRAVAEAPHFPLGLEYHSRLDDRVEAGYLGKDERGYYIQPAQKINGNSFRKMDENELDRLGYDYDIRNYVKSIELLDNGKKIRANLIISGMMGEIGRRGRKHTHYAVYEKDLSASSVRIPMEMWHRYEEDRDLHRDPNRETRHLKYNAGKDSALFYIMDPHNPGKLFFFGPTLMFRLPYKNTPLDLLPETHRAEQPTDLAEAIFGYTRKDKKLRGKEKAYAGRVFFSDAHLTSDRANPWLDDQSAENGMISPKILSTPKPTSFQHYLTQQEPDDRDQMDHYDSPPPHATTLRGHKRYWHKREFEFSKAVDPQPDDRGQAKFFSQHTLIKPVREGVEFEFTIRFENLSPVELGLLLWTLTLPGEENKTYYHHIGMGKPYGFGTIKIEPYLHLEDRKARYQTLFQAPDCWEPGKDENNAASLEVRQGYITDFETYMQQQLKIAESQTFGEQDRIKILLAMHQYPGADKTQYLKLRENDGSHPYRERWVLPGPDEVRGFKLTQRAEPLPRETGPVKNTGFADQFLETLVQVQSNIPEEGQLLQACIIDLGSMVYTSLDGYSEERVIGQIQSEQLSKKMTVAIGKRFSARVTAVDYDQDDQVHVANLEFVKSAA